MISTEPNEYLKDILRRYNTNDSNFHVIVDHFKPLIGAWGKPYIEDMKIIGSVGYDVSVKKEYDADLDIVLLFRADTPYSVKELYESLVKYLRKKEWKVEVRNISMRINFQGINVDFVPAIKKPGRTGANMVYSRKLDKELESNTDLHKKIIKESGRSKEIKLMKILAHKYNLSWDGFTLCLVTIEALKGAPQNDLANNLLKILNYIANKFEYKDFRDPSRKSEIISDNMDNKEKKQAIKAAKEALKCNTWNEVFRE